MRGLWALTLDASVEATAFSHDFSVSLRTLKLAERGALDIKTRCGGIPAARSVKLVIEEQWRLAPPRTQFFHGGHGFRLQRTFGARQRDCSATRTGSI